MFLHSVSRIFALAAIGSAVSLSQTLSGQTMSAPALSAPEALNRYLSSYHSSCGLDDQAMQIEIQASLPKLKKEGTMDGLKIISASGQVAYRFLRFTGDKLIKTDVIARFLTAEAQPPERRGNIGTTLKNYKFHLLRTADYQGARAYVFQLRPRKKREGLYKGELWLDAASGVPLREAGQLVKSPSIFIHRVTFVRDYGEHASCGPPNRTSITVETRIAGDAEMLVLQHPVADTWQPADADAAISQPIVGNGR